MAEAAIEPEDWVRRDATQLWQKDSVQLRTSTSYVAVDK